MSIQVYFECSTLHQLCLDHRPKQEGHASELEFVLGNVGMKVLDESRHAIDTTQLLDDHISNKEKGKIEHANPSHNLRCDCFGSSNFVILSSYLNVLHDDVFRER